MLKEEDRHALFQGIGLEEKEHYSPEEFRAAIQKFHEFVESEEGLALIEKIQNERELERR